MPTEFEGEEGKEKDCGDSCDGKCGCSSGDKDLGKNELKKPEVDYTLIRLSVIPLYCNKIMDREVESCSKCDIPTPRSQTTDVDENGNILIHQIPKCEILTGIFNMPISKLQSFVDKGKIEIQYSKE